MVPDPSNSDSSMQRMERLLALLLLDSGERRRELERLREVDPHAAEVLERALAQHAAARATGILGEGNQALRAIPDRPSGSWVGAYQIVRELGRGGMGTVYLAHREKPFHQDVALKRMHPGLAAHLVSRFHLERQFLASLVHPGIVHLMDGGDDADGTPFFVMEYVDGIHLDAYCERHGASVEERVRLMLAVAEALAFAHRRGVVHRDLKPSNILVGADGRPRVVDFGLAKGAPAALDGGAQALTASNVLLGTPSYMAPERLNDDPGRDDPAVDVYALGVILFLLLARQLPFQQGKTVGEWVKALQGEAPPLRRVAPALSKDLETITAKALAREPRDRFQDAGELAGQLRRFLAGESLSIRPPSRAQRLSRWASRYRRPLLAWGASTAVVLVSSLVLLATWNGRLQRDREALRGTMRTLWAASTRLLEELPTEDPAAASFYEELSRSFESARGGGLAGADPSLDRQVAVMHRHFGSALVAQTKAAEALPLLDRSIALLRPLPPRAEDPVSRAWTEFDLFRALVERAVAFCNLHRHDEALRDSDEALGIIRGLAGRFPDEPARLEAEAHQLLDRGRVLLDLNRIAERDAAVLDALALMERSVRLAGDDVDAVKLNTLSATQIHAARLTTDSGAKERLLRGAVDTAERLLRLPGPHWFADEKYADAAGAMAGLLLGLDRPGEALPYYEKALPAVDRLLARWPGDEVHQRRRRDLIEARERCRRAPGVASNAGAH